MEKDDPTAGANTTASSDSGSNNTPGSQASQTTMPPRRRLFTITAKGKEKARRKLKEIQDAKAKYDEDSENSIHSSGLGHDDSVKAPDHANKISRFSTPDGNQITISDEALEAVREKALANMMSIFATAGRKKTTVSTEALQAVKLVPLKRVPVEQDHKFSQPKPPKEHRSDPKVIKLESDGSETEDDEFSSSESDSDDSNSKDLVKNRTDKIATFIRKKGIESLTNRDPVFNVPGDSSSTGTVTLQVYRVTHNYGNGSSTLVEQQKSDENFLKILRSSKYFEAGGLIFEPLWETDDLSLDESPNNKNGFPANGGNQITVSDEAINAAKELIHLDDSNEVVNAGAVNATCLPEAGVHKNAVSEDDLAADKNAMVFENQNEIVVLMTDQDCSLSKVEVNSLELDGPSDGDETFCSDSDPEVAECTRILLEDIESSNDEAEWTSPTDSDHNKKPKYTLACVPSVGGDIIPSLQVLVVRVYSIMYCVLGKDNKNCFITEKAFANRQMDKTAKEAELRKSLIPGVEAEVRKQLIKKENINPKELTPRAVRSMSTDELLHILNNCEDDAETVGFVMIQLNPTAKTDLERARTELSENIQRAVAEAMTEKMKSTQPTEKVPSRVLKLRVMDEESCNNKNTTTSGVITIWNAQDEIINNIREGKVYDFEFLKPASFHPGQEIRLGSTKTTRISPVECDLVNENLFKRQLSVIPDVIAEGFNPPFGEFDTVGVVMKVEGFKEHIGQIVHLIEGNGVVLKVKFWNNIQDWDLQDILKPGKTIACLNLQWRLTSVENTMAFAQESSEFITNPKEEYLLNGFQKLSEEMEVLAI
ncbi:unnamed protein product [Orchesella dallaii]|uniref:BRCA2 OB3 domain-containing protein n=1 Tax=Orchesella dallaii TaxID=48710 RepID=A0ABP1R3T1_9HEXA